MRRRLPYILLAAVLLLSFSLNARMAANPRDDYQSADERAYGKLALDIADNHHYGSPSTKMREPLHWPPGAPMLFAAGYKQAVAGTDWRSTPPGSRPDEVLIPRAGLDFVVGGAAGGAGR